MNFRFATAVLAFILPTMCLGYVWHLVIFPSYYASLKVYRADLILPFGVVSMVIQGVAWAYLYGRLFTGESVVSGALRFAALAAPLAWSFLVLFIAAKHQMTSVPRFVAIETAFTGIQFLLVSPLIALAFSGWRR